METLDLGINTRIEARNLKNGAIVSRGAGPVFKVVNVSGMKHGGVLVQGKNITRGGLVEIGCYPNTEFQIAT